MRRIVKFGMWFADTDGDKGHGGGGLLAVAALMGLQELRVYA